MSRTRAEGSSAPPDSAGNLQEFCDLYRDIDDRSIAVFDSLEASANDEEYKAAMVQSARVRIARAEDLEAVAPAEVREDLRIFLNAFRGYASGNEEEFQSSEYLDARDRMEEWIEENCGYALTDEEEED